MKTSQKNSKLILECELTSPFTPVSLEDLSYLVKDPEFGRILSDSSIYMICKRKPLLFNNIEMTEELIRGEIIMIGENLKLKFSLPLYQSDVIEGERRNLVVRISYNDIYKNSLISNGKFVSDFQYIDGLFIAEENGDHLKMITPELLIDRNIKNLWKLHIDGDKGETRSFNVLYIGEAVKGKIWNRVNGHEKIQSILSRESPSSIKFGLAQELFIIFFTVTCISDTRLLTKMNSQQIKAYFTKSDKPNSNNIEYDAEKVLIHFYKPKYNIELYQKYPESSNGAMILGYSSIVYTLKDYFKLNTTNNNLDSRDSKQENKLIVNFETKEISKWEAD